MAKAYVGTWKMKEKPETGIDYSFCSSPENAAYWGTRQEAENDCRLFEHHRIVLEGQIEALQGFKVEERGQQFVVFCEGPFIPKQ